MIRKSACAFPLASRSGADTDFRKTRQAGLLDIVEFGEGVFDVLALLSQVLALLLNALHEELQLTHLARRVLIDLNNLANLGDSEANAPAAQYLFYEVTVGGTEETRAPTALRMNQSFILIETQRSS
ncbi:conserved hypothetical protein [Sinorhizobium medicae]|uniref:Uncharacterized protein n=1 Tax=Sinorhizobium medicae TaxID=110321 RepID=A0A508WRI9_9HYPH|nr:conserved hypothetical protein [Sinorhizobium medicae]